MKYTSSILGVLLHVRPFLIEDPRFLRLNPRVGNFDTETQLIHFPASYARAPQLFEPGSLI